METEKLSLLLDDPEVRVIVYGLAHAYPAQPADSGPDRLHAVLHRIVATAEPEQAASWLSDQAANSAITIEQIDATFGEDVIRDLASYAGSEPAAVRWQLTNVLPDLVDAFSSQGTIVEADEVRAGFDSAIDWGDRSAGAFGFHVT